MSTRRKAEYGAGFFARSAEYKETGGGCAEVTKLLVKQTSYVSPSLINSKLLLISAMYVLRLLDGLNFMGAPSPTGNGVFVVEETTAALTSSIHDMSSSRQVSAYTAPVCDGMRGELMETYAEVNILVAFFLLIKYRVGVSPCGECVRHQRFE